MSIQMMPGTISFRLPQTSSNRDRYYHHAYCKDEETEVHMVKYLGQGSQLGGSIYHVLHISISIY